MTVAKIARAEFGVGGYNRLQIGVTLGFSDSDGTGCGTYEDHVFLSDEVASCALLDQAYSILKRSNVDDFSALVGKTVILEEVEGFVVRRFTLAFLGEDAK